MHNLVIKLFKDHFSLDNKTSTVTKNKNNAKKSKNKKHGTTN